MKTLILILMLSPTVNAASEIIAPEPTTVRELEVPIELNAQNVKMSIKGYRMPTLKILVPILADYTFLNHRSPGEEAPCLPSVDPLKTVEDVIQGRPGTDVLKLRITHRKHLLNDGKTCQVYLREDVEGELRGVQFVHNKEAKVGERPLADCR